MLGRDGEPVSMWDLMGKDAVLFHHATDEERDDALGSQYVQQSVAWFDSLWNTVATPLAE